MNPRRPLPLVLVALLGGALMIWSMRLQRTLTETATADAAARDAVELHELIKLQEKTERQREELASQLAELTASSQLSQARHDRLVIQQRTYDVLLGRVDVRGPGIRLVTRDVALSSAALIDLVNTLKNLGAEVIAINGQRLVPRSFVEAGRFTPPVTVEAIGNARLLAEALGQSGGMLEQLDVPVTIEQLETLTIPRR